MNSIRGRQSISGILTKALSKIEYVRDNCRIIYYDDMLNHKQGLYQEWHPDGDQIKIKCKYINNKLDGDFESWYIDGQRKRVCFYQDGMMEGEHKKWDTFGQLIIRENYHKDELHGNFKSWYENGNKEVNCAFQYGRIEGDWKKYDNTDEELIEHRVYKFGIPSWILITKIENIAY